MSPELVSVIMPIWNNRTHVADAVAGVVDQQYEPIELILVDDGSADGSGDLARRAAPDATYIRQSNLGSSAARNRGVEAAAGTYLAFCDADDRWRFPKLARQLDLLRADPELTAVVCRVDEIVDPGARESARLREPRSNVVGYLPSALVITRGAFAAIGPFDETLRVASWAAWWTRYRDLDGQFDVVEEVLVERRLHAGNAGVLLRSEVHEYLKVVAAHRRRGSSSRPPFGPGRR